jgi:hypothetical protein
MSRTFCCVYRALELKLEKDSTTYGLPKPKKDDALESARGKVPIGVAV